MMQRISQRGLSAPLPTAFSYLVPLQPGRDFLCEVASMLSVDITPKGDVRARLTIVRPTRGSATVVLHSIDHQKLR